MVSRFVPGFVLAAVVAGCSGPAPAPAAVPATSSSAAPKIDPVAAGARLDQAKHPAGASKLPSGRTDYRTLPDVTADLTELAGARPDVVRPLTLPSRSVLGNAVTGVEITHDVGAADGKPVFLLVGAHHANEWPTVDVSAEFATDLAEKDGRDPRVTALLDRVRVIVVPVVNPDGYDISRGGDVPDKRRNCPAGTRAQCVSTPEGGVDLNRNYAVHWGGPGSSADPGADDYRGPAPFSEPETRNIRDLVSSRQVTVLVSLHTHAALNLRPPGQKSTVDTPDEPAYAALGQAMADANGYRSVRSRDLYETSGSTSEWSYHTTGGFGFETELAGDDSHVPFPSGVVDQYFGTDPFLHADGGTRESLLRDAEAAADRKLHSVLTGTAPEGATLTLTKSFVQSTQDAAVTVPAELHSAMTARGLFSWDVNPSVRPGLDGTATPEDWTLRCSRPDGTVLQQARIRLARGESRAVDLGECARQWK